METLWIKVEKPEEKAEVQDFILHVLAEEGLTGEIPVKLYIESSREQVALSHIYDVSDDALFSLCEKYGERNVKLTEEKQMGTAAGQAYYGGQQPDGMAAALERIAAALEGIDEKLGELSACVESRPDGGFLQIDGYVTRYEG